ncbi:MAG TPA: glycine cleavage system aminomethyltransferase GcvT, partial [Bdellovibrionales bacterium]|nr:glycine cleavage system aminomethyltransferase GcvT [Bdellovibrionales bacterium]
MNPKSTPLKDEHIALGAKMVDFAGWYMPVEYSGLRAEHENVRARVGLFDVSHMGEIRIKGDKALETVEWLTSNHAGRLEKGQAQYSLLTNAAGGLVDDLIVYCMEKGTDYLLCVNASNTDKDFAWIVANNRGAEIVNESEEWGQIAVQGPLGLMLTAKIFGEVVRDIPSFEFRPGKFSGQTCLIARTGYTGEDGVEIFVPANHTAELWRALLREGEKFGVTPVGLGARDTLRTEMKYPLYGHEIDDKINPYSAGLGWVIKPDKKDFIGRAAMLAGKEEGLARKLIGFKMTERGIPRQGYKLFSTEGQEIGFVTSGTPSPSTGENIGVGYVDKAWAA